MPLVCTGIIMNDKTQSLWNQLQQLATPIQFNSNKTHYMMGFVHALHSVNHITDQEKEILIDKIVEQNND